MAILRVNGASLYYEVHGRGPWLAFAHGAGGNHLSWWQQVPAFCERFQCVIYDQRGWGRSSCEGVPEPAAFADDLAALLDHVGATRAALVGQSMGGWTVLGCALRNPERVTHLLLTGTLAGLTDDAMLRGLIALHPPGGAFDPHLALAPDFPARQPAATFLYDQIAGLNPPMEPAVLAALIAVRYSVTPEQLKLPILFLAGERDQLFPPDLVRQARAKLAGADLVFVPGAGHSVYFENPQVFNRALAGLLDCDIGRR